MTGPRIEYVDQLLLQILPAFEAGLRKTSLLISYLFFGFCR